MTIRHIHLPPMRRIRPAFIVSRSRSDVSRDPTPLPRRSDVSRDPESISRRSDVSRDPDQARTKATMVATHVAPTIEKNGTGIEKNGTGISWETVQ